MSDEDKSPSQDSAVAPEKPAFEEVDVQSLLLEYPLYRQVKASPKLLAQLRGEGFQFDGYCVHCAKEATFRSWNRALQELLKPKTQADSLKDIIGSASQRVPDEHTKAGTFTVRATCQRDPKHLYSFFFELDDSGRLTKVGQSPSIADIAMADLSRYRPVIEKEWMRELSKATGLVSHGIGIGAFVYLRRIFEGLINQHYDEYAATHGAIEDFSSKRMNEKVKALAPVLPAAMVEHSSAYGVLSLGIHELDEKTCSGYFPVIREAILMILEQDLRAKEQAKAAARLKAQMGQIMGDLSEKK